MAGINTVIFDIGNVLMGFRWFEYVESVWDKEMAKRVTAAIWYDHRWTQLDYGIMSTEEVLDSFIKADPEIEEEIRYTFSNVDKCMHRLDYAIPWVKEVKAKGVRVLFLSNYSYYLREIKPEVLDFIQYMDGGVFSCEVNLVKPDKAIYRAICDKFGCNPSECIFIDDNADNVKSANEFGLNAFLFENYEQARAELDTKLL